MQSRVPCLVVGMLSLLLSNLAGAQDYLWKEIVIEGATVDQAFGHAADPASPVASDALVPAFVALAVIGLIPLLFYYRALDRRSD